MRLVDETKEIIREIIEQSGWWLALGAAINVARIVFDALHEASAFEHFEIVFNALAEALGFEVFLLIIEVFEAVFILGADFYDGAFEVFFWRGIVAVWENTNLARFGINFGRERVDDLDVFDLIEAEFDAVCPVAGGWENIDRVAADAEITALKRDVIAVVLDFGQ